jgi:outer membrane protein assembly factor BamE (lipoprotein component of BamABCDE complex)
MTKNAIQLLKILALLTAALLTGCAGTQFNRVTGTDLVMGQTSSAQIMTKLGKPFRESSGLSNGQNIKTVVYAYAGAGMATGITGVTPVKVQSFSFSDDKLVAYQYLANLVADSTNFDDSKVRLIEVRKTTAAQVIEMLGKPSGEAIYPTIKSTDGRALKYEYSEMRGFTPSTKRATIVVGKDNIVQDVDYQTQGNWGK